MGASSAKPRVCRLTVSVQLGEGAGLPETTELGDEIGLMLLDAGAPGYEVRDATTLLKPPPGELHVVGWVTPEQAAAAPGLQAFLLARGLRGEVRRDEETEDDEAAWRDGWKRYFDVQRVGRLVVVPSWLTSSVEVASGELDLVLDPGRAFGTGAHASTRLCLQALLRRADAPPPPASVLDVGTGSGILALFAQRLWPAARVLGMDNDPEAIEVARENLEHNRGRFLPPSRAPELVVEELAHVPGQFELVLANLSAPVLGALAGELFRHVAPGGRLVVSGLLAGEADDVSAALVAAAPGARETDRKLSGDGWAALELLPKSQGG